MAVQRTLARKPAAPDRRPVPATGTPVTASAHASEQLQRRLGNAGVSAFLQRASLRVSSPTDPAEREATATAANVMRMAAPPALHSGGSAAIQRCACEPEIQRAGDAPAPPTSNVTSDIQGATSGGTALPGPVRSFMEPRFGADFGGVRIHTGDRAAQMSESVNAQAFTVGNHIFFGKGQYQPDKAQGRELIAHELTHTVQQGKSVQRTVAGGPLIQRQEDKRSWWEKITDFGEETGWTILQTVAPSVVPLVLKGPSGVFDWLTEKIGGAVEGLFSSAMAPVRAITGIGEQLSALFGPVVATMVDAAGKIAQNDCSPLREAAAAIERAALAIITPIVEKLQPVVAKVKGFLNAVWEKLGAPVWGWIKEYAAEQWRQIQMIGEAIQAAADWIWKKTAWIRSLAERAWVWLKNKIGIGEGPEGQDGILQWIQRKAEAAWAVIKAKIEPFKRELTIIVSVIGAIALAVSPAGPILAVGAAVAGAVQGLRWIAANWGKGNLIVQARVYLEKTLIPSLLGEISKLTGAVTALAARLSGTLAHLAAGLGRAVGALAATALSFVVSAVQWIADQAVALSLWAEEKLGQLTLWVTNAVGKLKGFLGRMLAFFKQLAGVIIDIYGLPVMLAGEIWEKIPACVRDPVVDFIGPIILRQIELFAELAKDEDAWKKTKADVANIIKLVFKDHDLLGAIKAGFYLILRVFNIPPDLLGIIAGKAMAAWDVISKKPLEFIKNVVRSLGVGFRLMWEHRWENLKAGLQGWLFGELKEQKINPPASWTDPKDLFFFALEVMGITVDHMWELLAKRFDEDKVKAFRKRLGQVMKVLDWINKSIDTTKSPKENAEGIWGQTKDFAASILTGIAEWVAAKVAEELAIMATAAAASGGLSEVLDVVRRIYKALVTAKRYMRRILDMVNQGLDNVLDIAGGQVEKVGAVFEKIMKMGMPVIIGFLAEQVGLGGVGEALRDIVKALRAKVDEAILWFIDKIKAAIDAIIGAVKAGVAALLEWWNEKREFQGADGKPHSIYFEGGEQSSELIVKSTPKRITVYLNELVSSGEVKNDVKALAEQALELYEDKIAPVVTKKPKDTDKDDPLVAEFAENLTELSKLLMKIVGAEYGDIPDKAEWGGQAPDERWVEYLSTRTSTGGEEKPSGTAVWWKLLQGSGLTRKFADWKQMHMITHRVGGKGDEGNLVPAPTAVNSGTPVRGFETSLEALVRRDSPDTGKHRRMPNVVWVLVEAEGFHPAYAHKSKTEINYDGHTFLTGISFQAGLFRPDESKPGEWVKDPTPMLNVVVTGMSPPDFEGLPLDINTIRREYLTEATGVTPRFALDYILPELDKHGKFENLYQFEARMAALRQELGREEGSASSQAAFDENVRKVGRAERAGKIRFEYP
jgi:hypothetical protein